MVVPGMTGEDGKVVTENLIIMLHGWDDDDVDAEYSCPLHYDGYHDDDSDDADDRNLYLEMKPTILCKKFLLLLQKTSILLA